jgi:erythronate-4-phosphate dehydrogenase
MKIVIDKNIPFVKGIFDSICEILYLHAKDIDNESVIDADVLIVRTRTKVNEQLLANSKIRLVCSATAGYEHIDFDYCRKNAIEVFVARGCNAVSVAQYTASAIGFWVKNNNLNINDLTLGIVGWGFAGKEVEKIANILGMNVLINDVPLEKLGVEKNFVSLQTIAQQADIITFHTPLTFEGEHKTFHLAGKDFFNNLRHKPLIINAARGGVIDEKELLCAYNSEIISDCVLDSWENEPNISIDMLKNSLLATPHIAGYSADGKANATKMCVEKIDNFFGLNLKPFTSNLPDRKIFSKSSDILKIFVESYNIQLDSSNLKNRPEKFEFLRNNYPERREIVVV